MIYYNYDMQKELPQNMRDSLQKYFPEKTWGATCLIINGEVDLITIEKVVYTGGGRHGDEMIWTHFANIQRTDNNTWELNEQFKGENEQEMWIYGYFKTFGAAVRNLATKGTKDRKPIKIY